MISIRGKMINHAAYRTSLRRQQKNIHSRERTLTYCECGPALSPSTLRTTSIQTIHVSQTLTLLFPCIIPPWPTKRHADVSVSRPSRTTSKAHPTTTTTMRERASITRRTRVSSEPTLAVGACPSRRCRRRPLLYVLGLVAASYTTDGIVARIFDAKHGACRPNHLHTALVLDSFPQNRRLQHCRLGRGSFWQIRLALSQTRVLLRRSPASRQDACRSCWPAGRLQR